MIARRVLLSAVAAVLLWPSLAAAQTFHDCRAFTQNVHDTLDCLEALFSEDPLHLTLSGMPPGNGVALGAVLEQNTHYVSPFSGAAVARVQPGSTPLQPSDIIHFDPAVAGLTLERRRAPFRDRLLERKLDRYRDADRVAEGLQTRSPGRSQRR